MLLGAFSLLFMQLLKCFAETLCTHVKFLRSFVCWGFFSLSNSKEWVEGYYLLALSHKRIEIRVAKGIRTWARSPKYDSFKICSFMAFFPSNFVLFCLCHQWHLEDGALGADTSKGWRSIVLAEPSKDNMAPPHWAVSIQGSDISQLCQVVPAIGSRIEIKIIWGKSPSLWGSFLFKQTFLSSHHINQHSKKVEQTMFIFIIQY